MSVSNLTNGCKKAIIELSPQELKDLELGCLARTTALLHLRDHTPDVEDRQNLNLSIDRVGQLLKRLRALA